MSFFGTDTLDLLESLRQPHYGWWAQPTAPVASLTGSGLSVTPTCAGVARDHEYAKFDRKRLFCRHCGETKEVR